MEDKKEMFHIEKLSNNVECCIRNTNGVKVAVLQNHLAERIFTVLNMPPEQQRTFNCLGAMDVVVGRREEGLYWNLWRKPKEEAVIDPAAAEYVYGLPCCFQCAGTYELPSEFSIGYKTHTEVLHEGMILQRMEDDFLVFDKPGILPSRITTWKQVLDDYPKTEEVRFFQIPSMDTNSQSHPSSAVALRASADRRL